MSDLFRSGNLTALASRVKIAASLISCRRQCHSLPSRATCLLEKDRRLPACGETANHKDAPPEGRHERMSVSLFPYAEVDAFPRLPTALPGREAPLEFRSRSGPIDHGHCFRSTGSEKLVGYEVLKSAATKCFSLSSEDVANASCAGAGNGKGSTVPCTILLDSAPGERSTACQWQIS